MPRSDELTFMERAGEYHHRDSLTREEYEALMELSVELGTPSRFDTECFVLGSYEQEQKRRLNYLCQEINNWDGGNYRAYLMEKFRDDLHPIVEFKLIADYSDHLIGVCEHDQGGFQLELGMLLAITEYQERSVCLKRSYPEPLENEKYNWMLDAGAFDLFRYHDNLWNWAGQEQFEQTVEEVLSDILD